MLRRLILKLHFCLFLIQFAVNPKGMKEIVCISSHLKPLE